MAKVQVTNVTVLDNPTAFQNPFQFEITFECLEDLPTGERRVRGQNGRLLFSSMWMEPNLV